MYEDWEQTLIIKPNLKPNEPVGNTDVGIDFGFIVDHPLNKAKESLWGQYFGD